MMNRFFDPIKNILLVILTTLSLLFGMGMWHNYKSVEKAKAEVVTLQGKADGFEREIKTIRQEQEQFAKQLRLFNTKQKQLSEKHKKVQEDLKNVSPESKAYLDTPIPDDVRRMLDSILD